MVKCVVSRKHDNKVLNSVMHKHTAVVPPVKSFALKSNAEFESRSSSVFSGLCNLEKDHTSWISENETHESFEMPDIRPENTPVFKKPFAPLPKKRQRNFLPYRRNMKKWIKYSLKDVPVSSDATNTAVALHFLSELRKKKETVVSEMTPEEDKVTFRKPTQKGIVQCGSVDSSLLVMNKNKLAKNPKYLNCESSASPKYCRSNIKLEHLHDDSEEDSNM